MPQPLYGLGVFIREAMKREPMAGMLKGVKAEEAFVTAISPSNLELYYDN